MSWLGGLFGGAVKPVADAAGRYGEAREGRKARQAEAWAVAQVAAATWRPWLAKATGICLVVYAAVTALMVLASFVGQAAGWSWATVEPNGPLDLVWARWTALGSELFGYAALFITTFAAGRSAEKVASNMTGRGLPVSAQGFFGGLDQAPAGRTAVPGHAVRREPARPPAGPVQRMPGLMPAASAAPTSGFRFSARSLERLADAHPDLQRLAHRALELSPHDFGITETLRTMERQRDLVAAGKSWTMNSRHLQVPACALDHVIYLPGGTITWDVDLYRATVAAFKQASEELGVPIVCGADWSTRDFVHIELDRASYPDTPIDVDLA